MRLWSAVRSASVGWTLRRDGFLQAYNAYALAQTYLKRGQHAEAIVEYEQSLQRFAHLDDDARTLAHESATTTGNTTELERFHE